MGIGLLSLVIFFTQSISLSNIQLHRRLIRCPPWGGFEQLCLPALLKGQSPGRLSTLSSRVLRFVTTERNCRSPPTLRFGRDDKFLAKFVKGQIRIYRDVRY